jgi:hypothetical protein
LSALQKGILLGLGLQHKVTLVPLPIYFSSLTLSLFVVSHPQTVDDLESEFDVKAPQLLALFSQTIRRISKVCPGLFSLCLFFTTKLISSSLWISKKSVQKTQCLCSKRRFAFF